MYFDSHQSKQVDRIRSFDWTRFAEVLRHMSPAFYAGSLLVIAGGQLFYALRWRVVLRGMGIQVSYGEVLRQYLIGQFFNNVMPAAVGGDAAKIYYLGRRAGYVRIGASVLVDRLLGLVTLAVLGAALAWIADADSTLLVLNRRVLTSLAIALVASVVAARVVPVERLMARTFPLRWQSVTERVGEFVTLAREGMAHPMTVLVAGIATLVFSWLITVVYQQYFIANALPAVPYLNVMLVIVSMAIFVNVPLTINGIGLREQLHVLLFAGLGIPREVAVWISLLLFSHFVLLSLAGCGLWLRARSDLASSAT